MPGPRNAQKKRKSNIKASKKENSSRVSVNGLEQAASATSSSLSSPSPDYPVTPPPSSQLYDVALKQDVPIKVNIGSVVEEVLLQQPYIHDPGNGPRVRDTRAFLESSFFAQPPALDDPLRAEFAQEEVLQMLCTILPEETALILWYNKSRATSRICPACQRLYLLGDVLQNHLDNACTPMDKAPTPQLGLEQQLSGLCSPVCFVLASFNYPGAIKSAWGRKADEIDDVAWELLNGPGASAAQGEVGQALGMLVKMTRLHDLGLAQLCFGDESHTLLDSAEDWLDDVDP